MDDDAGPPVEYRNSTALSDRTSPSLAVVLLKPLTYEDLRLAGRWEERNRTLRRAEGRPTSPREPCAG